MDRDSSRKTKIWQRSRRYDKKLIISLGNRSCFQVIAHFKTATRHRCSMIQKKIVGGWAYRKDSWWMKTTFTFEICLFHTFRGCIQVSVQYNLSHHLSSIVVLGHHTKSVEAHQGWMDTVSPSGTPWCSRLSKNTIGNTLNYFTFHGAKYRSYEECSQI